MSLQNFSPCIGCDDVLLSPRYSSKKSRSDCDPSAIANRFLDKAYLPIIASPMDTVYSPEMEDLLTRKRIPFVVHRYFKSFEDQLEFAGKGVYGLNFRNKFKFFAVGSLKNKKWINGLIEAGVQCFCIDMAHGDTRACVETVKYIKKNTVNSIIMAGNVATRSGFSRLEDAGADMIRVGIGSGSACATREMTGFGVPIITSVAECFTVRDKALIIADGGIKSPGDIAKVIAYGADLCMLGKMFASTSLAPGGCYNSRGDFCCEYKDIAHPQHEDAHYVPPHCELDVAYKEYRGMASAAARQGVLSKASIEGASGLVPYSGTTEDFIDNLRLNLQASLSYGGSKDWNQFRKRVKKRIITAAAWRESMVNIKEF